MGLFLSLAGITGSTVQDVRTSLDEFLQNNSDNTSAGECEKGCIVDSGRGITLIFPEHFMGWEECTQHLSSTLQVPAFSFHIHDGDFWMYTLFSNGTKVDMFNPIPDYWGDMNLDFEEEDEEEEEISPDGNAEIVASLVPEVTPDSIRNYLVRWNWNDSDPKKAYPDDEFTLNDCWQLVDFMQKLGYKYPFDDQGNMLGDEILFPQ